MLCTLQVHENLYCIIKTVRVHVHILTKLKDCIEKIIEIKSVNLFEEMKKNELQQ